MIIDENKAKQKNENIFLIKKKRERQVNNQIEQMVFNREKEKNGIKTMLDNVYQTESGQQKNVGFF